MPDEEFNVLGEDELALLTSRFEMLHENWVNMRRNTRTCFQCGKPGHFVADCPEKVENKDGYKHKSRTEGKYRLRRDHKSKHKNKHKEEQRSRKKESRGKARVMVGAGDVTLVLRIPPRPQATVKTKVIIARAGSRPRT
jgi:hypothetical protein